MINKYGGRIYLINYQLIRAQCKFYFFAPSALFYNRTLAFDAKDARYALSSLTQQQIIHCIDLRRVGT